MKMTMQIEYKNKSICWNWKLHCKITKGFNERNKTINTNKIISHEQFPKSPKTAMIGIIYNNDNSEQIILTKFLKDVTNKF